jgi:uncharacterized Zn finger protein (UPF0148 family)
VPTKISIMCDVAKFTTDLTKGKILMRKTTCEFCDSADLVEKDGFLFCQYCGTKMVDYNDLSQLRLAAEQGDAVAQTKLGDMFCDGEDLARSSSRFRYWGSL